MNSHSEPRRPIPLTQGQTAWVSPEDFRRVYKRKWCLHKARSGKAYAQTNMKVGGRWVRVLLHRFVLDATHGVQVDHENGDGLDCRRCNLRFATHAQNMHNSKPRGGSSAFKGVSWSKAVGKWRAQIMAGRKYRYLGAFESEAVAARAYDAAARELHGEFARLNFPECG